MSIACACAQLSTFNQNFTKTGKIIFLRFFFLYSFRNDYVTTMKWNKVCEGCKTHWKSKFLITGIGISWIWHFKVANLRWNTMLIFSMITKVDLAVTRALGKNHALEQKIIIRDFKRCVQGKGKKTGTVKTGRMTVSTVSTVSKTGCSHNGNQWRLNSLSLSAQSPDSVLVWKKSMKKFSSD